MNSSIIRLVDVIQILVHAVFFVLMIAGLISVTGKWPFLGDSANTYLYVGFLGNVLIGASGYFARLKMA